MRKISERQPLKGSVAGIVVDDDKLQWPIGRVGVGHTRDTVAQKAPRVPVHDDDVELWPHAPLGAPHARPPDERTPRVARVSRWSAHREIKLQLP